MTISENYIPFFITELHRLQQYEGFAEAVMNWKKEEIFEENKRYNLLSLFQYRMASDPGFYQHVLDEIQKDDANFNFSIRYLKYLWYSRTFDPISLSQDFSERNIELEKRLDEIFDTYSFPRNERGLEESHSRFAFHSSLDPTFIDIVRDDFKNGSQERKELIFLQLTRNRNPYSEFGNVAHFATKGKKDPKLWMELDLDWHSYFSEEITYQKYLYPNKLPTLDVDDVLISNEKYNITERTSINAATNIYSDAKLLFRNTDYCSKLRKNIADEFNIEYKPFWKFIPPEIKEFFIPAEDHSGEDDISDENSSEDSSREDEFSEDDSSKHDKINPHFFVELRKESWTFLLFQKFTTDCIGIIAEFWFLRKTREEMCSILNQEWKFSIEQMLDSIDPYPLSYIQDQGTAFLNLGCVEEAIIIYERYLSRAQAPEELYLAHMNLAECHRALEQYDRAESHYLKAKEIVYPFRETNNWKGLDKDFSCPEAYDRQAEIHIREMKHLLKKKEFNINPKKFFRKSSMTVTEQNIMASHIYEIYFRLGLGYEGFKIKSEWDQHSLEDTIIEYNLSPVKAEKFRRESNSFNNLGKSVNRSFYDEKNEQIWEERDKKKIQYQDLIKIFEESFQLSQKTEYCAKLNSLQLFNREDITILRQAKMNCDAEGIFRSEVDFNLERLYQYAVSLFNMGNYSLCSNITKEYLDYDKDVCESYYWLSYSPITDQELIQAIGRIINSNSQNGTEKSGDKRRIINAKKLYYGYYMYLEYAKKLGLWGISAYAGSALVLNGKFEEGIQVFSDELERQSLLKQKWEKEIRFSYFIDIIIENACKFEKDLRCKLFDKLEELIIAFIPDYNGVSLINTTYLHYYWLTEGENWFKGKKIELYIGNLSDEDKSRVYYTKGRFYLKRGSMGAQKMLDKAKETSSLMSEPGEEMMRLQLAYADLALLKKDFSEMKECYKKIIESGYRPDNPYIKKNFEEIEKYLERHLTLDKLASSHKLSEAVNFFEIADSASVKFYNVNEIFSSKSQMKEKKEKEEKEEKMDCSLPLSHYAWGLDKYLYVTLWEKAREYVFSKNIDESQYNDLKHSQDKSMNSWYLPFEHDRNGKSKEHSPTLGNWMYLKNIIEGNQNNIVLMHMSDFFQKYDKKLLSNIVEISKLLQPYRNDICHAKPVYMTPIEFQEERIRIVNLLNNLFGLIADLK